MVEPVCFPPVLFEQVRFEKTFCSDEFASEKTSPMLKALILFTFLTTFWRQRALTIAKESRALIFGLFYHEDKERAP